MRQQDPSYDESVQVINSLACYPKRGPETANHPHIEYLAMFSYVHVIQQKTSRKQGGYRVLFFTQHEQRRLEKPI